MTKKQRETVLKKALRQRVRDIACGAAGYNFDADGEFATADFLSRFIRALKETFGEEQRKYMWDPHCLDNFDTIDTTTDFLWRHGVRA